ncbi:MAG: helix-turn-helix domain-containing protein [Planctomycetota bacterium]|jgi:AraC-like DNA-binding protein
MNKTVITKSEFNEIKKEYCKRWPVKLIASDSEGTILFSSSCCSREEKGNCVSWRKHAIEEAARWGEATICACPNNHLLWAVPIMINKIITGGIIAVVAEDKVLPQDEDAPPFDLREACFELRNITEEKNITNADYLALRRQDYSREQKRAYLLHNLKSPFYGTIRDVYLSEEPCVISAIRRGDRQDARKSINNILLAIYTTGRGQMVLLKSLLMELVVSMYRTAVEMGGDTDTLLGANYEHISELSKFTSEDDISRWLVDILEKIMDSIRRNRRKASTSIGLALQFMRDNFSKDITRKDVATACHLSESHFSRTFRKNTGSSFSDVLTRMRINHAAELLINSDLQLLQIAFSSGFNDQSYFCKVFRETMGISPKRYRSQQTTEV